MPVTYPVVELIARELYTRLDAMTDYDATYQTEVLEVVRPKRLGTHTPADMQIVLVFGNDEVMEELMCPGNPPAIARRQTFNIHCHVMNSETDDEPIDQVVQQFIADVKQAVCKPQATWHTFDSNAIDAEWGDEEHITGEGGLDGVTLPLLVTYRTDENNPYNVRA